MSAQIFSSFLERVPVRGLVPGLAHRRALCLLKLRSHIAAELQRGQDGFCSTAEISWKRSRASNPRSIFATRAQEVQRIHCATGGQPVGCKGAADVHRLPAAAVPRRG
jgi:hypothetical protein